MSIELPASVEILGDSAFRNCSRLYDLRMSENIKRIGKYCFSDCKNLGEVQLPDSISQIGAYAFQNSGLRNTFRMSKNITEISPGLFENCRHLEEIMLPNGVEKIGSTAFLGCIYLASITILPEDISGDEFENGAIWKSETVERKRSITIRLLKLPEM